MAWWLYLYAAFLGAIVFSCSCADPESTGYFGAVSRFFVDTIPNTTARIGKRVLGEWLFSKVYAVWDWIVNQKNPLLQIMYLVIINGAYIIWLIYAQPRLPSYYIGSEHAYIAFIWFFTCLFSFYKACNAPPGNIPPGKAQLFEYFPYDGLVFPQGRTCSTCDDVKPARSKHCSLCGHCVSRFDHHCVWLNQCVGEGNIRYFLAFLLVNTGFFLYGACLVGGFVWGRVVEEDLLNAQFYHYGLRKKIPATYAIVFKYMLGKEYALIGVFVLAVVMFMAVGGFMLYHLTLIYNNTTTNEAAKWGSLRAFHRYMKGCYARYLEEKKKNPEFSAPLYVVPSDFDRVELVGTSEQKDDGSTKAEPVHVTAENGSFALLLSLKELPDYLDFEPPAMPENIYNRGMINNFKEVLFPRYDAVLEDLRSKQPSVSAKLAKKKKQKSS